LSNRLRSFAASQGYHQLAISLDSLRGGLDLQVFTQHSLFVPFAVSKDVRLGWRRQGLSERF
jgi:hypothetical protein